jgi:hypothetical protein
MANLQDVFGDLASFSLANEFINNDNVVVGNSLSLFKSEYINYIYAGIAVLIVIIGFLIYKFNYVKRKPDDNNNNNNNNNNVNSQCFGGICPR